MRNLYCTLLIVVLIAVSGCIQNGPQPGVAAQTPGTSPATTNPSPNVSTTEKTALPTTAVISRISPYISINDIGIHYVGESFSINGWSDLPGGSRFHVDIMQQLGRHPQHGDVIVGFSGDTILNRNESRDNYWSMQVETSGFVPALYDITVTSIDNPQVWKRAYFNITATPEPSAPGLNVIPSGIVPTA